MRRPTPARRGRRGPLLVMVALAALAALAAVTVPGAIDAGAADGGAAAARAAGTTRAGAARPLPAPDEAVRDFVDRINALRSGLGLGTLRIDAELSREAAIWASTMDDAGRIFHSDDLSRGITADWHRLGENVGVGGDVGALFEAFVASPTHYANLIDPSYTHLGVGVVNSPDGARLYTAHRFMALRPPTAPAPSTPGPEVAQAPPATTPPTTAPPTTVTSTTTPPTAAPPTTAPVTTAAPATLPKLGPVRRVAELLV